MRISVACLCAALAFALAACRGPAGGRTTAGMAGSDSRDAIAAALLVETNRVRRENGRRPLRRLPALDAAADQQAAYIELIRNPQHHSPVPGQRSPAERVRARGIEPAAIAENVASTDAGTPAEPRPPAAIVAALVRQWMESPGHRANLLAAEYTRAGSAVWIAPMPDGTLHAFGVQVYVRERSVLEQRSGR